MQNVLIAPPKNLECFIDLQGSLIKTLNNKCQGPILEKHQEALSSVSNIAYATNSNERIPISYVTTQPDDITITELELKCMRNKVKRAA